MLFFLYSRLIDNKEIKTTIFRQLNYHFTKKELPRGNVRAGYQSASNTLIRFIGSFRARNPTKKTKNLKTKKLNKPFETRFLKNKNPGLNSILPSLV
ncbi:hypothetical protein [Ammoniphilus sp. 3BR4]|uniref:hypothetical protein n=1 Tax=Ammoniphilus sp. 3BR4 TaxID=3158265 RepID=UPI00346622EC